MSHDCRACPTDCSISSSPFTPPRNRSSIHNRYSASATPPRLIQFQLQIEQQAYKRAADLFNHFGVRCVDGVDQLAHLRIDVFRCDDLMTMDEREAGHSRDQVLEYRVDRLLAPTAR